MENMSTHPNAHWNRPPNTNKPDIFVTGWGDNLTVYPNILTVNPMAWTLLFMDDPPVIKHQN